MGTQEVELERAGEKSAVDSSDLVCSFIHIIHNIIHLGPRIFRAAAAVSLRVVARCGMPGYGDYCTEALREES